MGINSTEVAYGFGQFGSAITDDASSGNLRPPKGLVIVAITALADATFDASADGLVSELNKNGMPLSITTVDTAAIPAGTAGSAHEFGDIANTAHTDSAASGAGSNADGVVTLATATTVDPIRTGMIIESTSMMPHSKTDPYVVKSIESTTSITIAKQSAPGTTVTVAAEVASGSAEAIYFFAEHSQGFGGLLMDASDTIPAGVTIYGRWTEIDLAGGRVICYFGK
jgi:hypothetical protein